MQIEGGEYAADAISPFANAKPGEDVIDAGGFSSGERLYAVTVHADIADGLYKVAFITDSVAPISFVLN